MPNRPTSCTYLRPAQVARRYSISRTTLWRWCQSNPRFPKPVRLSAGVSAFALKDLENFEAELKSKD